MTIAPSTARQGPSRRTIQSLALFCWLTLLATGLLANAGSFPPLLPGISTVPVAGAPEGFRMPDLPLCLFRETLHWPCPFCGLTRGFVLIWQGRWQSALHQHALSLPLFLAALCVGVAGLVIPGKASRALRRLTTAPAVAVIIAALALIWFRKLLGDPAYW